MRRKREFRREGEILTLSGIDYVLDGVEGCGGSSVVYRAHYEDTLNHGCFHRVLIKELFPYSSGGLIYRDNTGCICCDSEAEKYMDQCRVRFYQGNQANLRLLEQMPEQISGNLNSCEAYGTYYSVLSVHGGQSLETLLEEEQGTGNLRAVAETVCQILDALECFHVYGILHLDISPDNILILQNRALLIDYNSVWPICRQPGELLFFSEKEGYSPPEVRLKDDKRIAAASDIYSVCAVFFRMLTGRTLSEEEISGSGLKRSFPKDLPLFRDMPVTASRMAVRIVTKGLNILPEKRYQTVQQMREDMEELILRIDGKGISHSALWEASLRSCRQQRPMQETFLDRIIRIDNRTELGAEQISGRLNEKQHILLKGTGGMGKTRFLIDLWKRMLGEYNSLKPVPFYIPLADYCGSGSTGDYICKYLLHRLSFENGMQTLEDGKRELLRFLGEPLGKTALPQVILLLDGMNEAGSRRSGLLHEIEEIGRTLCVSILVTDRTDAVRQYGLEHFAIAELLPLSQETVETELKKSGISCPNETELINLLTNPMMLSLYRNTTAMEKERGKGDGLPGITGMNDLIGRYLDSLGIQYLRRSAGDEAFGLWQQYLLNHFLPEIAAAMKRRKQTVLSFEQLYDVSEHSYHSLQKKKFLMAFPEYMGKTRAIFRNIRDEKEWFDFAVREQLMDTLDLLEKNEEGNYRLLHDNFMEYLCEREKKNRHAVRTGYQRGRIACCIAVSGAVLLLVSGILIIRSTKQTQRLDTEQTEPETVRTGLDQPHSESEKEWSDEEQILMEEELEWIEYYMSPLDHLLSSQEELLEQALDEKVLSGDAYSCSQLSADIARELRSLVTYPDSHRATISVSSIDTMNNFYKKPAELQKIMEICMTKIQEEICNAVHSEEYGRNMLRLYSDYLQAYTRACFWEAVEIWNSLPEKEAGKMWDVMVKMKTFRPCMLGTEGEKEISWSDVSKEDIIRSRKWYIAEVQELEQEMLQYFNLETTDWR